jgi:hypothetical protein
MQKEEAHRSGPLRFSACGGVRRRAILARSGRFGILPRPVLMRGPVSPQAAMLGAG